MKEDGKTNTVKVLSIMFVDAYKDRFYEVQKSSDTLKIIELASKFCTSCMLTLVKQYFHRDKSA